MFCKIITHFDLTFHSLMNFIWILIKKKLLIPLSFPNYNCTFLLTVLYILMVLANLNCMTIL